MVRNNTVVRTDYGELSGGNSHVFILKIWLENGFNGSSKSFSRGYFMHILIGERHYFQDLHIIPSLIGLYFEEIGAQIGFRKRMIGWLDYWKYRIFRHQ